MYSLLTFDININTLRNQHEEVLNWHIFWKLHALTLVLFDSSVDTGSNDCWLGLGCLGDSDGCVGLPQGPGLGVEYDWEGVGKYQIAEFVID